MSDEAEENGSYEVCLRCAEPNLEGTSRCQKCGSPLDPSARDHPWEMKTANHHAYTDAASPKVKPIIFWGAWLYFGPSALFTIYLLFTNFKDYLSGDSFIELDTNTLFAFALPFGYGILSIWALWSVTKGYLGR